MSLLFYAADNQINYLFNSHSYGRGNEPLIHVTATEMLKIVSGYFTNSTFHLEGLGGIDLGYQIQANSDLGTTNWQTLGAATADSAGAIRFDDTTTTNHTRRFYRFTR